MTSHATNASSSHGHENAERPRRALVLSGGGARGAYEAGVVTALCEREEFEIFCGTSIGAINAAIAAQDAAGHLRDLWRSVPERALIRGASPIEEFLTVLRHRGKPGLRAFRELAVKLMRAAAALPLAHPGRLRRMTHLLDPAPIVALLAGELKHERLKRTLIVGVTNLTRARPEAFYSFPNGSEDFERAFAEREATGVELDAGNYLRAILASAAIPVAFPNVRLPDRDGVECDYIDGGIGNNTPIRQAIDAGADDITVVIADHVALRDRGHRIDDLGSIALITQDIMQQQVLELDLKLTRRVNEAVLRGAAPGKRFVRIRTIGPTVAVPLPILGFANLETIERAFDQGVVDGRDASEARGLHRLFELDPSARPVATGETVFSEGDIGEEMFVVIDGEFELSWHGRLVGTLRMGDIFGVFAILGFGARHGNVRAKTAGRIAPVDRARFDYLVRYAPSFAVSVMRSLGETVGALPEASPAPLTETFSEPRVPAAHIDALRDDVSVRSFAAGDIIFNSGDPADGMYVVMAGVVEIGPGPDGAFASARLGQVFGELALCDGQPRTTTARAATDAKIVPVDILRFTELVQNNPDFAIEVMRAMVGRILMQIEGAPAVP